MDGRSTGSLECFPSKWADSISAFPTDSQTEIEGRNTMTVRGSRTQPFLAMAIQVTTIRNEARAFAAYTAAIAVS